MGIVTDVETAVDGLLTGFVTTKSAALVGLLAPIALSSVTIYVMLMGYAVMRGEARDSMHTVLWKFFKIAFIAGIALSAGEYQGSIVDGIHGIQGAITSAFGADTLGGIIDNAAQPYDDLGQQLWSEATTGFMPNFALMAAAGVVAIAQSFITIVAAGMYLLAKIAMALVLAVGPVFIFCAMFPSTQQFTEKWLAQAIQFALLNALLAAEVSMLYDVTRQFANHVQMNVGTSAIWKDCLALLAASGGMAVVILNTQGIASALSGGIGLQGAGRVIAQQALRLMQGRQPSSPRSSANQIANSSGAGVSGNTAGEYSGGSSARSNTYSAGAQATAGGSGYTPLYQRSVMDNIRKASNQ